MPRIGERPEQQCSSCGRRGYFGFSRIPGTVTWGPKVCMAKKACDKRRRRGQRSLRAAIRKIKKGSRDTP